MIERGERERESLFTYLTNHNGEINGGLPERVQAHRSWPLQKSLSVVLQYSEITAGNTNYTM